MSEKNLMPKEKVQEKVKVALESSKSASYNTIRLINLISGNVHFYGSESGKHYVWPRAGTHVDVDKNDAPELLAKRLGGKTCCGNSGENKIFELAE